MNRIEWYKKWGIDEMNDKIYELYCLKGKKINSW